MMLSLDYPFGRPLTPAVLVRRARLLPPGAVPVVTPGEHVAPAQPIAEVHGAEGQRIPVPAGLAGRVTDVSGAERVSIEGVAAALHGLVGLGGQAAGPVAVLPRGESPALVPIARGSVILFPHQLPLTLMQRAAASGAAGIIAASASARELEAFARADLTALLDGLAPDAPPAPLTVVLTEGLGAASMRTPIYQHLSAHLHEVALLDGTTLPRQGVRPEVLLSAPGVMPHSVPADPSIAVGALVSVTAGPRRGARGEVIYAFPAPQVTAGGVRAPAVRVRFEDGTVAVIPAHALDRLG